MDTQFLNASPALTKALAEAGTFPEPFTLLDVGAAGGIAPVWYAFGDALVAYGFDPLVTEIERLNAAKPDVGRVEYVEGYVVRSADAAFEAAQDQVFPKSSAWRSLSLSGIDWTRDINNSGADVRHSTTSFSLDDFARIRGLRNVDFIKTDTDGYDYSILLGARETLRERRVLGVAVEVSFNTAPEPEANLWANHDVLLRGLGFSLFDIDVRRYTRAALPGKFRFNVPSPTVGGQVCQGDAIYLRDFADPGFATRNPGFVPTPPELLKMIALFEIFGLGDCAIELFDAFGSQLGGLLDVERAKTLLAGDDYGSYMRRFEEYVRSKKFAAFPDDYEIVGQGMLLMRDRNPKTAVFRTR